MSGVARYHAETASSHPQGAFVLYEDYAALLERIAALEADAARYRWLREYRLPPQGGHQPAAWIEGAGNAYIESEWLTGERADAAIDAALDAARVGGA